MPPTIDFLPMSTAEMDARGWRELDVLLVTGDAYFDHPSHGAAVIGRVLEKAGFKVGIIAQPDWRSADAFKALGRPALFAGVTGGAVDSIVNNYTAHLAKRRSDAYSPGGRGGRRPDMATLVYTARLKEAFPKLPIVLGGVEASLRRFAYIDALSAKLRRSILVDSRADILVYGAGEIQVVEIARRLAAGENLAGIPGTARLTRETNACLDTDIVLPSYEETAATASALVDQTLTVEIASRPGATMRLRQRYAEGWVVCEPSPTVDTESLDRIFALPFVRAAHPNYSEPLPAFETVRWSVISHRGCAGGCSFCGLAAHQGRAVVSRSEASILDEIRTLSRMPDFKGTISDVGGPTANAYGMVRKHKEACERCRRVSCLHPHLCPHLSVDPAPLLRLLQGAQQIENIRHVFLASGIRHDLALIQPFFIEALAARHTGGHLKVAPEHVSPRVLSLMRKPPIDVFEAFEARFREASKRAGKKQYIVPYFIAGFPGCDEAEADMLEVWLKDTGRHLEQCQGFMPLAGTSAAAMAHAGQDDKQRRLFIPGIKESRRQKEGMVKPPSGVLRSGKNGGRSGRKG